MLPLVELHENPMSMHGNQGQLQLHSHLDHNHARVSVPLGNLYININTYIHSAGHVLLVISASTHLCTGRWLQ